LQITDDRGALQGQLIDWQLRFTFAPTSAPAIRLTNGIAFTTNFVGDEPRFFIVDVPPEAIRATNTLATINGQPTYLLYSDSGLPDPIEGDPVLLFGVPAGFQASAILDTNLPPLLPRGQRYYLAVRNFFPGQPSEFSIRVDFEVPVIELTNAIPYRGTNSDPFLTDLYSFEVSTNAGAVQFVVTNMTGDVDLFLTRGPVLPSRTRFDYRSVEAGLTPEFILLRPSSRPVPLTPGRWYLGVRNVGAVLGRVSYDVIATEFPVPIVPLPEDTVVSGTNTVDEPTSYFGIIVPIEATGATLQLTNLTADANLFIRPGFPIPSENNFAYASTNQGTTNELIAWARTNQPVRLTPGLWLVAVTSQDPPPMTFDIVLQFEREFIETLTNGVGVTRLQSNELTRHFRLDVPTNAYEVRFELFGMSAPADLSVALGTLPTFATDIFADPQPGLDPEVLVITTNDVVAQGGSWYAAVDFPATNDTVFTIRGSYRLIETPPTNPPPFVLIPPEFPGGPWTFQWVGFPGCVYQLQRATNVFENPINWVNFSPRILAVTNLVIYQAPIPTNEPSFFRLLLLGCGSNVPPETNIVTVEVRLTPPIPPSTNFVLEWDTTRGCTYQLQSTANLLPPRVWSDFGPVYLASNNLARVELPQMIEGVRFFRALVLGCDTNAPPPDTNIVALDLVITPPIEPELRSTFQWATTRGCRYQIQSTTNVFGDRVWTAFSPVLTALGSRFTYQAIVPNDTLRFFRVIQIDCDPNFPPVGTNTVVEVVVIPPTAPATNFVFQWASTVGCRYQVESSTNFLGARTWTTLFGPVRATATVTAVEAPLPDDVPRLFRVVLVDCPTNTAPPALIVLVPTPPATNFTFTWNAEAGCTYQLEATTNLFGTRVWSLFGPQITATNSVVRYEAPIDTTIPTLFRVQVIGCGLTNLPPTNATPVNLRVTLPTPPATNFVFEWNSDPGCTYRLEGRTNLIGGLWSPVSPDLTATSGSMRFEAPVAGDGFSFFRVVTLRCGTNVPPNTNTPPIQVQASITNGAYVLRWNSQAGCSYQLEVLTNLVALNWVARGATIIASGAETSLSVPLPAGGPEFYRVRLVGCPGQTVGRPAFTGASVAGADQLSIAWSAVPSRRYEVQFSTNPFAIPPAWTLVAGPIVAGSSEVRTNLSIGQAAFGFFRVQLLDP
jgi:hypothetical protein